MAKARSQSRIEASSKKLKKKMKEYQNCYVRLNRLKPDEIKILLIGQSSSIDKPKSMKKYDLRKRMPNINVVVEKPNKSLMKIVAASQAALCTAKAMRIWEALKKQSYKEKIQLNVNQIVCARMSGHRPWPARIISFEKIGTKIIFYGTRELGIVKKSEIIAYEMCKDMLEQYLKVPVSDICNRTLHYHLSFLKACKEVIGENV